MDRNLLLERDGVVKYSRVPGMGPKYNWVAPRRQERYIC